MPSFPKCERHSERMCPLCDHDMTMYRTINALREFRGRLIRDRNKLTDDIAKLDAMISRAARPKKSKGKP